MFAVRHGHAILNDWKVSNDPYERDLNVTKPQTQIVQERKAPLSP